MRTTKPRARRGCAAALALLVAGCAGSGGGSPSKREQTSRADAAASVPAGWQRVSSLGLQVSAPGDWPFNAWSGCGKPPPALIERDQGGVAGCGNDAVVPSALRIRVLQDPAPGSTAEPASEPTSVALGTASGTVVRGRTDDGRYIGTVEVPDLQAQVSIESPDEKVVEAVLDSVRAVDVDGVGCTTRLGASPSWDRAAPGPAVVLSGQHEVASVGVCHYQRSRASAATAVLASSALLTGAQADAAVRAIEQSAAGALPAVPETQCLREPETDPLWLHVAYADQADAVPVHVRYSTCEPRWTASPSGVSHVSQAQLDALLGPLHTGYGYANGIPPR